MKKLLYIFLFPVLLFAQTDLPVTRVRVDTIKALKTTYGTLDSIHIKSRVHAYRPVRFDSTVNALQDVNVSGDVSITGDSLNAQSALARILSLQVNTVDNSYPLELYNATNDATAGLRIRAGTTASNVALEVGSFNDPKFTILANGAMSGVSLDLTTAMDTADVNSVSNVVSTSSLITVATAGKTKFLTPDSLDRYVSFATANDRILDSLYADSLYFGVSIKRFGAKGDGSSDDREAIQNTLDYASSHGIAKVLFPGGKYIIDSMLVPPSNVHWQGAGSDSTMIQISTTFDTNDVRGHMMIVKDGGSNVNVSFDGITFDGNKSYYSAPPNRDYNLILLQDWDGISVTNCVFQNCASGVALAVGRSINIFIHGNKFINNGTAGHPQTGDAIYVGQNKKLKVVNNYIKDCTDYGIALDGGTDGLTGDALIFGNTIDMSAGQHPIGWSSVYNVSDYNISNNFIKTYTYSGIFMNAGGGLHKNIIIKNNIIKLMDNASLASAGIYFLPKDTATCENVAIEGNLILLDSLSSSDNVFGILCNTQNTAVMRDFNISGNRIYSAPRNGIVSSPTGDRISITGNVVIGAGRSNASNEDGAGIYIYSADTLVSVNLLSNLIQGKDSTMTYGIYLNALSMSHSWIIGNVVSDMKTGFNAIAKTTMSDVDFFRHTVSNFSNDSLMGFRLLFTLDSLQVDGRFTTTGMTTTAGLTSSATAAITGTANLGLKL